MTNEPYSIDDLNLDLSSATWVDGAVWVEGKTHDGIDISAGFEPSNLDPVDGPAAETDDDGLTFRAFGRFRWLHEVGEATDLEIE